MKPNRRYNEKLRDLMYSWHDGQGSPLYAAASSGLVADPATLVAELRLCAMRCTHPDHRPYGMSNHAAKREAAELRQAAELIETVPSILIGAPFVHPFDRRAYWPLPWAVMPSNPLPYEASANAE